LSENRFAKGDEAAIGVISGILENSIYGAKINSKFDMYVLKNFISRLVKQDVVQNGCTLDRTFLDIGKVKDFQSGFDLIKGMDTSVINGSALVGLDDKTERKL